VSAALALDSGQARNVGREAVGNKIKQLLQLAQFLRYGAVEIVPPGIYPINVLDEG